MTKGERVQFHPATTEWMQGDKYGTIVGLSNTREYRDSFTGQITKVRPIRVKLDKSGKTKRFHPNNLFVLDGNKYVEK